MKIAHIITRLILGGAQENTLITCKLLAQRGHDVTLITGPAVGPEGELFKQAAGNGYKIITVPHMIRAIHPPKDHATYRQLKKIIAELKPDIVHTHSAKAGIAGRFAAWAIKKRSADNLPIIVHGVHGLPFHDYQSKLLNKAYIAIEGAAARRTDFFVTVADTMTEKSLAVKIGRAEQYRTAYSAIDEDDFLTPIAPGKIAEFRKLHNIPEDAVVLVTVARLFDLKGHNYIIESAKTLAKRFDNVYWLFVGDGSLSDSYKKQAKESGLENRVIFAGLVPPTKVPLAIQASDVLVHCSLREGLARALPQGMLCGRPAVSFDIDGAKEVVNENTGRLIEAENVTGLIDACAELIEDENLRRTLGENGREQVTKKFAPDTMVDTIEEVYEMLLRKR